MSNDPMTAQIGRDLDRLNGQGEFAVPPGSIHLAESTAAHMAMFSPATPIQRTPAGSAYIANPLTPNPS